ARTLASRVLGRLGRRCFDGRVHGPARRDTVVGVTIFTVLTITLAARTSSASATASTLTGSGRGARSRRRSAPYWSSIAYLRGWTGITNSGAR
ncbi:MAG: hypothetical protein WA580_06290, partial [Acidimicrobiales bacterium]